MSNKTCLTCHHYNLCKHPDKSFGYSCSSYKKIAVQNVNSYLDDLAQEYLGDSNRVSSEVLLPNTVDPVMSDKQAGKKERQLISYLDDVLENPTPIPRDLKFDDSDMKEYPNFYEWCMDKNGSNLSSAPFARQLAIAIHLFSEWCPDCSHERFQSVYTVPYKASAEKVAENVTFLQYGKCPKCGNRKSDLIKEGKLPEYQSFSGCLGQRSGKSALISQLSPYIIHKFLKMQNPNRLFGLMDNTVLSGTFVGLTFARAMSLLWTPVHNMITISPWFCLAEGTPITKSDGSTIPIELSLGERVKTYEGENEVIALVDTGVQECFEIEVSTGNKLQGTASHKIRCLSEDGTSLVWKTIETLTEQDYIVVDD